ncbi:hypothetical protein RHSIM_Rhsim09G0081100 [Rhododendron simsii]|uniref:Uncharacterized protein n=1 Tax=Rhododendron simsii TaxID=118357 RepID=A0A834LEJ3_RHOSS|nr:hypothetical protein RHSIM_Rhsim09G0081100 [Rhododendron simsii]
MHNQLQVPTSTYAPNDNVDAISAVVELVAPVQEFEILGLLDKTYALNKGDQEGLGLKALDSNEVRRQQKHGRSSPMISTHKPSGPCSPTESSPAISLPNIIQKTSPSRKLQQVFEEELLRDSEGHQQTSGNPSPEQTMEMNFPRLLIRYYTIFVYYGTLWILLYGIVPFWSGMIPYGCNVTVLYRFGVVWYRMDVAESCSEWSPGSCESPNLLEMEAYSSILLPINEEAVSYAKDSDSLPQLLMTPNLVHNGTLEKENGNNRITTSFNIKLMMGGSTKAGQLGKQKNSTKTTAEKTKSKTAAGSIHQLRAAINHQARKSAKQASRGSSHNGSNKLPVSKVARYTTPAAQKFPVNSAALVDVRLDHVRPDLLYTYCPHKQNSE